MIIVFELTGLTEGIGRLVRVPNAYDKILLYYSVTPLLHSMVNHAFLCLFVLSRREVILSVN